MISCSNANTYSDFPGYLPGDREWKAFLFLFLTPKWASPKWPCGPSLLAKLGWDLTLPDSVLSAACTFDFIDSVWH